VDGRSFVQVRVRLLPVRRSASFGVVAGAGVRVNAPGVRDSLLNPANVSNGRFSST
jgi:hypothetical protein